MFAVNRFGHPKGSGIARLDVAEMPKAGGGTESDG
jgi:hypothetical protein